MDEPAPFEMVIWDLVERFHWTLDYARSISLADLRELHQIDDGKNKASHSLLRKNK